MSNAAKNYAPLYQCPNRPDSPVIWSYDIMRTNASILQGYLKIKLDVNSALGLAAKSPYPDGVKVGVMKQVTNANEITLEQTRIMLGWAAQKAQGVKVSALRNNLGI